MTPKQKALNINPGLAWQAVSGRHFIMDGENAIASGWTAQKAWENAYRKLAFSRFKTGDLVVMEGCLEASHYAGKVWKCRSDSYEAHSGDYAVFLEGIAGYFCCDYLRPATSEEKQSYRKDGAI